MLFPPRVRIVAETASVFQSRLAKECLMDVGSRWRDEAPIASQPASCHDHAQNLRRPFQRHRPPMPVEVRRHVASLGGIRVVSVVLGYFVAHYNTHHRLALLRSYWRF